VPFDISRTHALLQEGNLAKLFVEELGWEPCHKTLELPFSNCSYSLSAIAEKCSFHVWLCPVASGGIPDHATRLMIHRQLAQTSFEHLLIFATQTITRGHPLFFQNSQTVGVHAF
jgi:hypothetical protein